MKKIWNFIIANKHAIIWTFFYILITWATLYFMFNFNIFNIHQWHRVMNARLHGFPGFVFGILLLAMLPLYIATTTLIVRTKKPLITVPLPKIKIGTPPPAPAAATASSDATAPSDNTPKISSDVPDELRPHFTRAIRNAELFSAYIPKQPANTTSTESNDSKNKEPADLPSPDTITEDEFPLPTDFDIALDDSFSDMPSFEIPVFSDVNFDEEPDIIPDDFTDTASSQANQDIIQHLQATGRDFKTDNDIILTNTAAIIAHTDNDFWVTDPDNWFATGKSKPSPINAVKSVAKQHNLTPILYLGTDNILDLDTLIPEWESDGIKVITDISEI